MTIGQLRNALYETKTPTKILFLDEAETVVESFELGGFFFMIESHCTSETVNWETLHVFKTKESANDYFVNNIRGGRRILK